MNNKAKIQYLVVDTSAFIKNVALQDIGVNISTEQAVVDEIKNKKQLRKLVVLPYDLKVQEVFIENIKFVTEFSKKTGDYTSLSATDIKVIALTYQLEKEKVGTQHLKNAPAVRVIQSTNKSSENNSMPPSGFYMPKKKEVTLSNANNNIEYSIRNIEKSDIKENTTHIQLEDLIVNNTNNIEKQKTEVINNAAKISSDESDYDTAESDIEESKTDNLADKFAKLTCNPMDLEIEGESEGKYILDDILVPINTTISESNVKSKNEDGEDDEDEDYDAEDDEDDEDDDDSGWITPGNFTNIKKEMNLEILEEKAVTVACLTMDFAMQNVLMQMGLNVVSLEGKIIKQMRTFIFRCYACFKTTSIMTKIFCPHCGNKTLKKVEVTLDENGQQQIHINYQRPLSAKGKKFSLPTPKGGKHANNPILCEDQPMPQQRPSGLARIKNNPLDEDYIAGYSPFIMHDINSRSAILGIKPGRTVKYWMKRNPNETKRKRK